MAWVDLSGYRNGPLAFWSGDGSKLAGLDLSGRLFWGVTVKPCSRAKFVGMSHGRLTLVVCTPHYSLDRVFDADFKLFSNLFDLYYEQVSYILCGGPTR